MAVEFTVYGADSGAAALYKMVGTAKEDLPPKLVGELSGLDRRWTHFISGWFRGANFSDILCYNSDNGEFAFYKIQGTGGVKIIRESQNESRKWRRGWTHLTPAYLGRRDRDGIVFYNKVSGFAQVYAVDEFSYIRRLWEYDWRKEWTHILEGDFNSRIKNPVTDLLFYNASTGLTQIYGMDQEGRIALAGEHSMSLGHSHVVRGRFGGELGHDLFFYNSRSGVGEMYSTDPGRGKIRNMAVHNDMDYGWTHVVPIQTDWAQNIFFYNTKNGSTNLYRVQDRGEFSKSAVRFELPVNRTSFAVGSFL